MEGLPLHGPISDDQLPVLIDQGILVQDGIISEIGNFAELATLYPHAKKPMGGKNNMLVLPGFVDCHTHICWGGTRVNDYAMRVAGKSYLEIAATGGGIMDTVTATREASEEQLIAGILERAERHLRRGITTIEVKSGYGLSLDGELTMLRSIKKANKQTSANLIPTFLGAHIKPKDFKGSHKEYLDFLIREVAPIIQEEKLTTRADIFVEEGAFGVEESREYAVKMMELGFEITMHVDQFHAGGATMANELGCVSADHLECCDEDGIRAFADSETVAVALPGASLGLGMQFTPGRKILDQNGCLAIATDWNPGSAPMGDLLTQASVLGAFEKLSIAETLAAITVRAAWALRLDAGTIAKGKPAHLAVFETDDYRNLFYRQGQLQSAFVVNENEFLVV